eukprot:jgi/Psemu1/305317/fgenesh1_kg.191_\
MKIGNRNELSTDIPATNVARVIDSKIKNDGQEQKQSSKGTQNPPRRKRPFPDTSRNFLVDFATVPRDAFNKLIDVGVPLDYTVKRAEDVIVLYTSGDSMPTNMGWRHNKTGIDPATALENCHEVKVILQAPARKSHRQCFAILPQWESYTIHKWMRIPPPGRQPKNSTIVDLAYPLQNVARDHQPDWKDKALGGFPKEKRTTESNQLLVEYLKNRDRVLVDVKSFLQNIVMKNSANPSLKTLIVLTCNKGQSIMFHNFVCNARAKGLDLSHVVMFATDECTLQLGRELGIHTWYDETIFGTIPEQSANQYGDQIFAKMMMAKVYCMHLAMSSGYNILFQDVDVVWHQHPLPYLLSKDFEEWDMVFQDDGSRVWRFAPYSPNSGFYFVRNNPKTLYFFETFLRMGDMIQVAKSHQHVLNDLLIEFSSWRGLRVKVIRKGEDNVFPGGVEFHNQPKFMKEMINGTRKPYVFHMSWTKNKDNKKKFFEQLGEWYVMEKNQITTDSASTCVGIECCLAVPNITCHFSDKPSKIPCLDSPRIDGDKSKKSFW